MQGRFGIDFAWGRPGLHELRAAGVTFVGRYFSQHEGRGLNSSPGKDLDRNELHAYRAAGIDVVVAWETTATRAQEGELAGREDGHRALEQAHAVGWGGPIDFAVDFDASGPEVWHYFRGVHSVCGSRTGVYGGYRVVKYLFDNGLVSHAWQTYAWSGGQWDRRAIVRQYSNDHTLAGVSCDFDVALAPSPAPKPASSLDVLVPAERRLANSLLLYRQHPHRHGHGIRVTTQALIVKRKEVWLAATKGLLSDGKHKTEPGWGVHNRGARYRVLWSLTR